MSPQEKLAQAAQAVDPTHIQSPALRSLVYDVQTNSRSELIQDTQNWRDTTWKQWRSHSRSTW